MMPDRYDELRKRLMAQDSSTTTPDTMGEQDIGSPDNVQPTQPAQDEQQIPPKDVQAGLGYIPDLAAAVGPGLLATLGGASPRVASSLFDQGNKYAQGRGAQEEVTKNKLTTAIGKDGKPVYVNTRDAVGLQQYIKPNRMLDTSQNVQSTATYSNKQTGELANFYIARNGLIYRVGENETNGKPISPDFLAQNYVPFKGYASAETVDPYGTKVVTQTQRSLPSQVDVIAKTPGYGAMVGVPTEGIKETEKSLDEHNKRIGDLELKRNDLKSSLSIFNNPSATPTELTAARESLIRSITPEPRLTDEDVKRAMGNDFRSVFSQVRNMLSNKTFEQMSTAERAEFIKASNTLIDKMNKGIQRSYDKMLQESSTVPGGQGYLQKKTQPNVQMKRSTQAQFDQIKRAAAQEFGAGTDLYNKFVAKKALDLGIEQ